MVSRKLKIVGVALFASAAALAGCTDVRKERLEGAQQALAALPDLEVVSSDAAAGRITVRSRITGALSTIDLQRGTAAAPSVAAATAGPGTGSASGSGDGAGDASTAGAAKTGASAPGTAADASAAPPLAARPGESLPAGTQATVTDASSGRAVTTGLPLAAPANIVRDPQGRVQRIEGSGFSIERTVAAAGTSRTAPSAAAAAPAGGERRRLNVPLVCGAGETRSLQGVELDVPGAGIVAERGCTLTLANVRVRAGGWGLVVNPGATVRIDDSLVEGRTGALDLHPGGSLSAWATAFRGPLGRPVSTPQFVDRGGNSWD
jgi:hypothetical protein